MPFTLLVILAVLRLQWDAALPFASGDHDCRIGRRCGIDGGG